MNRILGRHRPRWRVPEVVQSSGMDCGPATLTALLEGFRISASYGRLREACQTDVDGTSINALEEAAVQLGLDAEQVIVPVDHVLLPEAQALPAIATAWTPGKLIHFVIVWQRHGPFVQVMDPSIGRRWPSVVSFQSQLYVHEMEVDASDWDAWAASDDFIRPLKRRIANLGVANAEAVRLIEASREQSLGRGLAELDAAVRMAADLVSARAVRRGGGTARVLRSILDECFDNPKALEDTLPLHYWFARPLVDNPRPGRMKLRGAVLVRVRGRRKRDTSVRPDEAPRQPLSPELAAALSEPPSRPLRAFWQILRAAGIAAPLSLLASTGVAAAAVILEALFFRTFIDISDHFGVPEYRWAAVGVVTGFLALLIALEGGILSGLIRTGRLLEAHLRLNFLYKIPRLGDRYFHSRLTSDMAERSHTIHHVRELPALGGRFCQALSELCLIVLAMAWIDPWSGLVAAATAMAVVGLPIVIQPSLTERDLRFRAHVSALTRFALDAPLGLFAIRAHSAQRPVRAQHEALLTEWGRAGLRLHRLERVVATAQALIGFGGAAWILWSYLTRSVEGAAPLLLAYWAVRIPVLGDELTMVTRQYPRHRNFMLRLLEPLTAPHDQVPDTAPPVSGSSNDDGAADGVSLALRETTVRATGLTILDGIDLSIARGTHVAIVGPSGAGKSTLVGLFLGWWKAAGGHVYVDGKLLTSEHLAALRTHTAWVDPTVQLWNRPLIDNLTYGVSHERLSSLATIVDTAELKTLLERLPDGFASPLGEAGGLVSGGEGQRVRFTRALLRPRTRLVVLDEAFRGLDRALRQKLLKRARHFWKDATFLCITHDVSDTLDFERVLVVNAGRIVEDDVPQRLAAVEHSQYRALLDMEIAVREELWSYPAWRRLCLDHGQITAQ